VRAGRKKRNNWKKRHLDDPYVKRAGEQGFRSRAAFKLEEIDLRDHLLRPGMAVVELGAAPGGWSQYVARRIGGAGSLVAVDLIEMQEIPNVTIVQGDFTESDTRIRISAHLPGGVADLVISDMAPNISGIRDADQARFADLYRYICEYCEVSLKPGGNLLVKLFEGPEAGRFRREIKAMFTDGSARKPGASRSNSREYYYLAKNKRR
jgi:23S rRNA (uridine2552-2'-O)-methyltransferase